MTMIAPGSNDTTDKARLVAVILAGGSGTRFWPLSTEARPKQFLRLFGERSMLQQTYDRLAGLVPEERILTLTSQRFVETVRAHLPDLPEENVIGEPMPKDTAAAVALGAAIAAQRYGDDCVMALLAADHLVHPVDAFQSALRSAAAAAHRSGALYTFGIPPTYPATGYGYLQRGDAAPSPDGIEHFRLRQFREKPDLKTAQDYVQSGDFFWNSGMFVWRADAILAEIEKLLPLHAGAIGPLGGYDGSPAWQERLKTAFQSVPKISIDFGVMEKAADVRMVKANFSWNDVGGWASVHAALAADERGNASRGNFHGVDAYDNLVFCEDPRETVALIGVKDLVVVRAGDRTLVVRRDKAEAVKQLVDEMRSKAEQD